MNDAARALIGRTLGGRFKLTALIGEGAMASVFCGEQSGEPRQVAVKVMHRGLASDPSFVRRFEREARAAARIDHPNTVRILEHGCDRDAVYIAMELLSGQDLFEVLLRERRLSQARAARILIQMCAALDAAHRQGVVHRDLKPENVMLIRDPLDPGAEVVKVLDFGIAKLLEREQKAEDAPPSRSDSIITLVGTVIGTPEYMSPEQARGVPPVDARSDIYACGVLLYQLVTGVLPFRGDSPIELILQHVERAPAAPRTIVPGIHPELERIILTALAKWPNERQESAEKLAGELSAILPELPGGQGAATVKVRGSASEPESFVPRGVGGQRPPTVRDPTEDVEPTLRLFRDEVALPDKRAASLHAKAETPEHEETQGPGPRVQPVALEQPSPWATAPRLGDAELIPRSGDEEWTDVWWVLLIALVVLGVAIWLTRYSP